MNTKQIPMLSPGEILKEEFLDPLEITPSQLAVRVGVSRPTVCSLVKGTRSLSVDMAFRLGRFFGNSPEFWLNLQKDYELRTARADSQLARRLSRIEPLAA